MKKNMKLTAIILSVMITISLTSCANNKPEASEIDVFMMNPDIYLESFLNSYSGPDGNINVDIEIGLSSTDMTANDVLKDLNTRLMGKNGPDVIIFDDIDPQNYIDAGLLADLSDITSRSEGIIEGIAENGKQDGKTYYIPLAFSLIAHMQQPEESVDFSSLSDFVSSLKLKNLQGGYFENMASIWYRTQFEPSVLSTGEISEEQIRAFFEELSELMDVADWSDYYPVVRASLYPGNYMVNPQLSCAEIFFDEIDASSDYVADLSSIQTVYSMEEDKGLDVRYAQRDGKIIYIPRCVIAVNENAANKNAAMQMAEYLISPDGQNSVAKSGTLIPVNRQVIEKEIENAGTSHYSIDGNYYDVKPFSNEAKESFQEVLDSLGYEAWTDIYLMEIILSGARGYLNGEVSVDDAVADTFSRAEIYLAE